MLGNGSLVGKRKSNEGSAKNEKLNRKRHQMNKGNDLKRWRALCHDVFTQMGRVISIWKRRRINELI